MNQILNGVHEGIFRTPADSKQVGGNHYKNCKVQPWDAMESWMTEEEFIGYLRGNVIKYTARAGKKGSVKEDLLKAQHYLDKLLEKLEDTEASNQLSLFPL